MGLPQLINDPRFKDNAARLENKEALNQILQGWIGQRPPSQVMEELVPAGGVVGPVYNSAQIVDDPHYQEREDILEIDDPELGHTRMLGVVSEFSDTPGSVAHAGPGVGEHNQEVYGYWLGYTNENISALEEKGII
jgi:crotonobetainyl-CoA:carnitine CoA-transferase CaiB-like acyl-CoA transferase